MTDAFTDHAVKFLDETAGSRQAVLPLPGLHRAALAAARLAARTSRSTAASTRCGWDELREQRHARMIEMGIVDKPRGRCRRATRRRRRGTTLHGTKDDARPADGGLRRADRPHGPEHRPGPRTSCGEMRLEENTLVMFLADNGGCAEESRTAARPARCPAPGDSFTSYGLPWANASNTPFRLYKHWVHEGGISTPLIVSWPAVIAQAGHAHAASRATSST